MRSFVLPLLYTISLITNTISDDETQQAIDTFYDETTDSTWIILSGEVRDDFADKWESNEKWDTINENIETQKDHYITRKCENVFGNSLCLCQFQKLAKIHNCHRNNPSEAKKQQYLRNTYTMHHSPQNPYNYNDAPSVSNARIMSAQNHLQNIASNMRSHPLFNRFWGQQKNIIPDRLPQDESDIRQEKLFTLKEHKIENEIAAAKIEADNNELNDDEIDEIEDEIDELIDEEQEFEQEKEVEQILDDNELIDTDTDIDIDTDIDMEDDILNDNAEYNGEIIDVLNEEVETESDLIEKQNELIEELKSDNAMKEELIEVLEQDDDDIDMDEYDENDVDSDIETDIDMDMDIDFDDDFNEEDDGEFYDDDNDEEVDVNAAGEEYYDNDEQEQELAQEDYDELYDVDGENNEYDDGEFQGYFEADEAKDLEKKEKEAMIADTFWGLEIYSIAFMVLCCCCISCYMHKTRCCGYCKQEQKTFAYSQYHQQGGFKRVFGNVDVDDDYEKEDVEMGVDQNNSDEAQALHS